MGAAIYFVWQERNTRIFKHTERTVESLLQNAKESIKWRIMNFVVKDTPNVKAVETKWNVQMRRTKKSAT